MTRSSRLRTPLSLLLVVVLGVLAGWTVVATGDTPSALSRTAGQEESESPGPSETATGVQELIEQLPIVSYDVFLARDPFQPVVPDPAGSGDGGGGGVPGVDPTDPTSPTPTDPTSPTPTPTGTQTPTDDGCMTGEEVVCDGQVVKLVDVTEDDAGEPVAVVQVGQQLYEVGVGDRFATNFLVLSINDTCVTLLFGDDNFVLCIGDQVLK